MDLSPNDSLVPREFLAVILAGYGSGLHPLTSDYGDTPCPKALLSVANKPMIDYTLEWIEQAGVRDVLILCPSPHKAAISHHIDSDISSSPSSLRVKVQTHDEDEESGVGTCAPIRAHAHRITEDFVVLPCDFIPPPTLSLSTMLNKFRTDTVSDGSILTSCWFECQPTEKGSTSDDWGSSGSPSPIVWDPSSRSLLHVDTDEDVSSNTDEMNLRMSLLLQFPHSKLSTKYQDSGVYVCKHTVLNLLRDRTDMESLRRDFIPWLCRMQYQRAKRLRVCKGSEAMSRNIQDTAILHSTRNVIVEDMAGGDQAEVPLISSPGSLRPPSGDSLGIPSLGVGLVMHRASSGFTARLTTLSAYSEANRALLSQIPPPTLKDKPTGEQKIQVSPDSVIGDSTKIEERTTIKKSVVGKHCTIGRMARLVGCVVLDHCVVEDGAKLEGCLLGQSTKIGAKAELVRCVTQAGFEVGAGESFRNEKLQLLDWTVSPEQSNASDGDTGDESDDTGTP